MKGLQALLADKTRLAQIGLVAVFMAPLLAHIVAGQFTRLLADDYCFGHDALSRGWWDSIVFYYNNWAGVFTSVGIQTAISITGSQIVPLLPAILLSLWLASTIWAIYQFGCLIGMHRPVFVALFLGALVVFATTEGTANIYQSLYWTSSAMGYVLPLASLTFYSGFIFFVLRRAQVKKTPKWAALFSVLVTFLSGGLSPIYVALQSSVIFLGVIISFRYAPPGMKRAALTTLLAGLAGSLIAMGIVVSAPGNAIRQAQFPASPSLPLLTIILLWSTISFVATAIIIFSPVPFMTSLVFSGLLANRWQQIDPRKLAYFKRRALRLLLLTASVGMILLLGSFLPASYSLSDLPPPRALIIMQFVLVLVVIAWGVIMGISLKKPDQRATSPANSRIVLAVLAVLLIIGPIRSTWNTLSLTGAFRTYAEEWDALDREIRLAVQNGTRDLKIAPYTVDLADYVDVVTIDPDPHQGANTCIAQYYGLDTISTG